MQKILVVDDDEDILEILRYILEDSGYEVVTLSDGRFLFDRIKERKPDLILLDVMLGDLDGRDLCKNVKSGSETNTIPIIMISATHHRADAPKEANGPDDFLEKPFDMTMLLDSVERQLAA